MRKNYKILLFCVAVFALVGISPMESQEPVVMDTKINERVTEVPPNDLTVIEEKSRYLHELQCELEWLAQSE